MDDTKATVAPERAVGRAPVTGRIRELDGLRGIAILLVMVFHGGLICGLDRLPFAALVDWGWVGVDLFFVLSGFLITTILLRTRDQPGYFRSFYLRRILRIFPAYYATWVLVFGLAPLLSPTFSTALDGDEMLLHALWLQNWDVALSNAWPNWFFISHFWSLAVEEQFYLIWPAVVLLVPPRWLAAVCIAVCLSAIALKVALLRVDGMTLFIYASTLTRMDGLALGSLTACVLQWRAVPRWGGLVASLGAAAALAVFLLAVVLEPGMSLRENVLGNVCISTITAAIIFWIATGRMPVYGKVLLRGRCLQWLGSRSYSLYLIHFPVAGLLYEPAANLIQAQMTVAPSVTMLGFTLGYGALSGLLAEALFRGIELPVLRRKDRVAPLPAATVA